MNEDTRNSVRQAIADALAPVLPQLMSIAAVGLGIAVAAYLLFLAWRDIRGYIR